MHIDFFNLFKIRKKILNGLKTKYQKIKPSRVQILFIHSKYKDYATSEYGTLYYPHDVHSTGKKNRPCYALNNDNILFFSVDDSRKCVKIISTCMKHRNGKNHPTIQTELVNKCIHFAGNSLIMPSKH